MDRELFLSLLMLALGLITLAVRNRPNPFVGVRFGYTYLSKEAWRKANTFAGLYCLILGLCFLAVSLSIKLPFQEFLAVYVISVIPMAYFSYRIAKETYEREDLSTPVGEVKPMVLNLRRALILQTIPILFYLVAAVALWNRIPETVAIHFGISGSPNVYASKLVGVLLLPLTAMLVIVALTILAKKEPLLLRFPTAPKFLIVLQAFLAIVFLTVLLYNVGLISGSSVVLVCVIGVILVLSSIARAYGI